MGRIRGRKPEDTRESVLAAATVTFAERGFANATLGLIAERAGVTAATLPYHFGDKRGLYNAVIEGIYNDLLAFGRSFESEPDLTFAEVVERAYAFSEAHRDGIRVMLRTVIETGALDEDVREVRLGATLDVVSRMLAAHYNVDLESGREAIIAITHLVSRFVTNSVEDNCKAFGVSNAEACRERIVALLTRTGRFLVGLDADR
ncbi:MAG: AcrR family transcriptional regulator [Myxococcota bacterium]|jgi:AcrR family transcriptional regulator